MKKPSKPIKQKKISKEPIGRELQYQDLFKHMTQGFAHCRMVYKDGKPLDLIYLSVNPAFETLTGLMDVTG